MVLSLQDGSGVKYGALEERYDTAPSSTRNPVLNMLQGKGGMRPRAIIWGVLLPCRTRVRQKLFSPFILLNTELWGVGPNGMIGAQFTILVFFILSHLVEYIIL